MTRISGTGLLFLALMCALIGGCTGATGSALAALNPFAGSYNGTVTYTQTNTVEPMTLTVERSGQVTGSFTDPDLGGGTLRGNVATDGTVSGTTLIGSSTLGTFTFKLTASTTTEFTGSGTFTQNGSDKAVAVDVTKT